MHKNSSRFTGFTLIEVIGVLSIIAIMASVIAPSVFDDIKRARQDAETQNLELLAEHLVKFIHDAKRIPRRNVNDWTTAIATMGSLPRAKVEFNERDFRRAYYVDPRFFTTTDTPFPGYTQQTGLATPPISPRIMLVSVLTGNAPSAPTTSAAFNAIWDQSAGATVVEGADIKIERLNLRSLFQRIVLTNENTNQPGFQLEAGARSSIPAASGSGDGVVTRYVIRNTKVNLYTDPYPSGNLDEVFLVEEDKDYAFQLVGSNWVWRRP